MEHTARIVDYGRYTRFGQTALHFLGLQVGSHQNRHILEDRASALGRRFFGQATHLPSQRCQDTFAGRLLVERPPPCGYNGIVEKPHG